MSTDIEKSKSRYLILHLLCWTVLIIVPLFFHSSNDDWTVVWNRYIRWLGNPVTYLIVFYLNYLWLVPRYLLKKKDWKSFLFINALVIIGAIFLMDVWHWCAVQWLPEINNDQPRKPFFRFPRYFWAVVLLILIIALAVAVRFLPERIVWIVAAYPAYQIWLGLVAEGSGAIARAMVAVPVGALSLAAVAALMSVAWRKAGADA